MNRILASITVGASIVLAKSDFDYLLDVQVEIAYSLIRMVFIG